MSQKYSFMIAERKVKPSQQSQSEQKNLKKVSLENRQHN